MQDEVKMPRTLGHVLDRALAHPADEAVVAGDVRLTYGELDDAIRRAQTVLAELGVADGDRVAVSLPNRAEIVVAFHAIVRLGAIYVGINTTLAPSEKAYMLRDSGARIIVTDGERSLELNDQLGDTLDTILSVDETGGQSSWHALLAEAAPMTTMVEPDHPAGIAYTSGTTGFPKGAVHSHHNLLMVAEVQIATRGYDSAMRSAQGLSLNILNVIIYSTLIVHLVGGVLILIATNNSTKIAAIIREHRVTHWLAVPPIAYAVLHDEAVTGEDLATLVEVTSGSAALSPATLDGFKAKFGVWLAMTYGLTEAPASISMEDREGRNHVPGASGVVLPHVEVFTIDESGRELPPGGEGELCIRAAKTGPWAGQYTTMLSYWNRPEASAAALAGGYLHTGDMGYVDTTGHVFVLERKSAMINRGGANVYPAEIERVLDADPSVAGSAAVGLPDDRLGQRVFALVEAARGQTVAPEALVDLCARNLARYKVPEAIYVVERFPRNTMNKIIRSELPGLLEMVRAAESEQVS